MTQEDYVTFEQAKQLKEKGFPQGVDYYDWDKTYFDTVNNICLADIQIDEYDNSLLSRPTLSLVQKWLREEKNIEVLEFIQLVPNEKSYNLGDKKWVYKVENKLYKRYEQALSSGIDKALKLI